MNSASDPAVTRITFRWRTPQRLECVQAIRTAVWFGYDTREALLTVLPQFSVNRLVLALDHLIAASVAEIVADRLVLSADLAMFDELVAMPLDLPVAPEQCSANLVQHILAKLGVARPAAALTMLRFEAQSVGDVNGE